MILTASVTPNRTKFGPLLFPGELNRAISELADIGYDGIELSLRTAADVDREELFRQLDARGLRLVSIATGQSYIEDGFSLFSSEARRRDEAVGRICSYIDLIAPHAGHVILGGIRGRIDGEPWENRYTEGCEAVDRCLEHAEAKNVILLLEAINRYETNLFNTVEDCRKFVASRKSEHLRILPDTFHMNIEEASLQAALEAAGAAVGALHCADSNRLAPGMGHLDFAAILGNISKLQRLAYVGVEVLPLPDSRTSAETAFNTLKPLISGGRRT